MSSTPSDPDAADPDRGTGRVIFDLEAAAEILVASRTVAVLGAHVDPWRAACYVPEYLADRGYTVLPVNPRFAGGRMWGQVCRAHLSELTGPIDLVDVFRTASALPGHLDELLALAPRAVWFQLGIRHDAVAERLAAAGIDVVQDRCTLADHRALGLGRVGG